MPQKEKPARPHKLSDLPMGLQIVLFIVTLGIFYWLKQRQQELEKRAGIRELLPDILQAIDEIKQKQNMLLYFANSDCRKLQASHGALLSAIPGSYRTCGLDQAEVATIAHFISSHDNLEATRKDYNTRFVKHEMAEFKDFFAALDKYPLSQEQMKAVICDEDNNLVIAGAGTGKTTTISAKVAYILEKNLARPEELLVISFTNTAVEEMFDRTCNFLKDDDLARLITFKTFNSFGNMVMRYCNPHPAKIAFDGIDKKARKFLQESFEQLFLTNSSFQQKAINFIAFFARPPQNRFDFKTEADYFKHEQSYRNVSLNGTVCKSLEEVMVANFLYLHQVTFEYECLYPLAAEDRNPDFGHYQPDFYLPEYSIYYEHYGIDENGHVPDRFKFKAPFRSATEQYQSGMQWKATIHEKYQTKLIKTYSFQNKNQTLLKALRIQLNAHGVILNKRPPGEILDKVKSLDDYEDFMGLVYTFLNLMKSNNTGVKQLRNKAADKRFNVFLDVFEPLFDAYQIELSRTGGIDYNDMVNRATSHIAKGEYQKKHKYILVDEFQDMSLGRYDLLKALKLANPEAKLYAVGDDWQSVFRFTGSDISIITQFSKHFGVTAVNSILQTYRFNRQILDVSSGFIQSNPAQLKKQLTSPDQAILPAFKLVPHKFFGNRAQRMLQKFDILCGVLSKIALDYKRATVFLIGRYHHNAPSDLRELQKRFPALKISYYTAHACKGLTCDVSVLLDLNSGVFGFPSEMADDPILSNLLHEGETFENAEERRLFYVALTRARHQVYMLYDPNSKSKFMEELMEVYSVGEGGNGAA
ncbi:UvrD-helicase domain-containing protein [Pedobacter frigidisoli]|uniref:UvrD-helicase domain-containing protein n=1 Tax=Pedobacter frigidisoli TaxID=2530455 RepID=UPI00292EC533|nr:UvrD-helicase domain-containing protein [Pedobacter frigidisoli]